MQAGARTRAPVLSVRGIRKAFGGTAVLHGIDLDLAAGEVLALVGENGAGKSTLLNIICGALRADGGSIRLDGTERHWGGPRHAMQAGIAFVHQELSVIRSLSVAENIRLGDYCARRTGFVDRAAMRADAAARLAELGAQHVRPELRAGRLGTADQQFVEIAKSLTGDLRVLILDEPTSSLTPFEADALFAVMRRLAARDVAIVFISHRLEEVFAVADRIAVLRDGRLVSDRPAATSRREAVIADMTGRGGLVAPSARPQPSTDVVLAATALRDRGWLGPIELTVRAGEIIGVFGLVGAGRSELLELLAGLRRPGGGTVRLFDGGGLPGSPGEAWARRIAFLPEDRKAAGILPNLSLLENMLLSWRRTMPAWLRLTREQRAAAPLLRRLAVRASSPRQRLRTLSGGNQQKVVLGRCLAVAPRLLLLDEPTRGVDIATKAEIYTTIGELAADGMAVIFASSELPEVLALATRVMVLARGQQRLLAENAGLEEAAVLSAAFRFQTEPAEA